MTKGSRSRIGIERRWLSANCQLLIANCQLLIANCQLLIANCQLLSAKKLIVRADRRAQFLVFVLQLVQLPVDAALGAQLLVAADFAELTFVHDHDLVTPPDGREPIGVDTREASFVHASAGFPDAQ